LNTCWKKENNWFPDFEAIEKNDLQKVKLMFVNYPQMPTDNYPQKSCLSNWWHLQKA
jgi:aspartate/methionine/tyrosine aminotransferase